MKQGSNLALLMKQFPRMTNTLIIKMKFVKYEILISSKKTLQVPVKTVHYFIKKTFVFSEMVTIATIL